MKKRFLLLFAAVCLITAMLTLPALAADHISNLETIETSHGNSYDYTRTLTYGSGSGPVTNQSTLRFQEINWSEFLENTDGLGNMFRQGELKNQTAQTDRTLFALVFYNAPLMKNLLTGQETSFMTGTVKGEEFRHLGEVYFFDVTLSPGEVVDFYLCSHVRTWTWSVSIEPCFWVNFESEEEMAEFERGFGFLNVEDRYLSSDGGSYYQMYLEVTKENAQFLCDLGEMVLPDKALGGDIVDASAFCEGLARVIYSDGSEGFIDTAGRTVIPAGQYVKVASFRDGKAVVMRTVGPEGKIFDGITSYEVGFIDKDNRFTALLRTRYRGEWSNPDELFSSKPYFNEGYVFLRDGKFGPGFLYDAQGKLVTQWAVGPVKDGIVRCNQEDDYGIEDGDSMVGVSFYRVSDMTMVFSATTDNPLKVGSWETTNVASFDDGLAPARVWLNDEDSRWGFVNTSGKSVISPQYLNYWVSERNASFQVFQSGIACVRNTAGKWGGIDVNGNTVIPFQYDTGFAFGGDGKLARVVVDGKAGYIDRSNNLIIPAVYDTAHSYAYSNDGLVMAAKNGKRGYLDTTGKEVLSFEYDYGSSDFHEGYAALEKDGVFTVVKNPLY